MRVYASSNFSQDYLFYALDKGRLWMASRANGHTRTFGRNAWPRCAKKARFDFCVLGGREDLKKLNWRLLERGPPWKSPLGRGKKALAFRGGSPEQPTPTPLRRRGLIFMERGAATRHEAATGRTEERTVRRAVPTFAFYGSPSLLVCG